MMLDNTKTKNKWNKRAPTVDKAILDNYKDNNSGAWARGHMYRTSYHDMSDLVSLDSRAYFLSPRLHKT